jgi:adenine-specific DNA methylase
MIYLDACYIAKLYSDDKHLLAAAPHFGLSGVTL